MNLDPAVTFIIVLVIGIAAGIIAQRIARPSWLSRQIADEGRADLTSALVGIAGAFIGSSLASRSPNTSKRTSTTGVGPRDGRAGWNPRSASTAFGSST